MSISYKTPASFADFSCLGMDCDDTCCRNWEVKFDRQHYDLLKNAISKNEQDQKDFEKNIFINNSPITSDYEYAFVRMKEDGFCTMLDDKGLCSIHSKYGLTTLGDVCTMFPRAISRCGDIVELSGSLSCPQVVRSCIDDDMPLKFKRFKTADLPRSKNYPIQRELSHLEDDFYSENFYLVRENLMKIMANEELDFETRLYILVNLAHKISDFYHSGCRKPTEGQLESVFATYSDKEFVSKLDLFIKDYDAGSPISMVVVHSVLSIKLQQASDEKISLLYQKIVQHYCHDGENVAELLAQQISKIRTKMNADNLQYIDKALTRYILNCLYREWFVSMPDVFTYVQMLLIRMSILRTLIYLDVGCEKELEMDVLKMEELKQKIVYIMYNFARNIDQNLEFLKVVYNALSEQTMMNFDFSPAFIRID